MVPFDVSALVKAQLGKSFTLEVDTGPQMLGNLQVDYLRGTVQVVRVQDGVFVEGAVGSRMRLECVRCLEPFALPVTLDLEEMFRLPGAGPKAGAPYAVGDDARLDLAPLFREQALVAVPMKPLCESDCKGLCPKCGVNLNRESCACEEAQVDPRLAVLRELL